MFRQPSAKVGAVVIANAPHTHQKKLKTGPRNTHPHAPQPHTEVTVCCCGATVSTHVSTRIRHSKDLRFFNFSCHFKIFQFVHLPEPHSACPQEFHGVFFWTRSTELMSPLPYTSEKTRLQNKVRTIRKGNFGKLLW